VSTAYNLERALNRIESKSCVEIEKLESLEEERNSSSYIYFTNYSHGLRATFEYTCS